MNYEFEVGEKALFAFQSRTLQVEVIDRRPYLYGKKPEAQYLLKFPDDSTGWFTAGSDLLKI